MSGELVTDVSRGKGKRPTCLAGAGGAWRRPSVQRATCAVSSVAALLRRNRPASLPLRPVQPWPQGPGKPGWRSDCRCVETGKSSNTMRGGESRAARDGTVYGLHWSFVKTGLGNREGPTAISRGSSRVFADLRTRGCPTISTFSVAPFFWGTASRADISTTGHLLAGALFPKNPAGRVALFPRRSA